MKDNFFLKQQKEKLERERYSSFVVDLRDLAKKEQEVEHKNKLEKVKYKKITFPNLSFSFKLKKKKKSPNLLITKDNNYIVSLKEFFSFKFKKPRNLWSQIFKSKKQKNYWRDKVREKHKILSTNFRLSKKERLALAQQKNAWYQSLLTFILVLIFLIIPIKLLSYFELLDISNLENKVMIKSKAAIDNLLVAFDSASTLDFKQADNAFSEASKNFLAAKDDLSLIDDSLLFLASLSNDPKLKLAAESKNFLAAGALSSSLGRNLILATNNLFEYQERDILLSLEEFLKYGELAVYDAQELEIIISKINPNNLPEEYQSQFIALKSQAEFLSSNLENFVIAASKTKEILGLSRDKRYLLIFQNNSELRASGGFLGSYALIDVSGAKIKNLEIPGGGSYDTEGGMLVKVKSPEPLWLVNPLWHFWDANWWPDWPKTAQNLMWFYEKSGGSTVDGVISFTPTVVENLLTITGPIDLTAEYGVVIDSNNFWEVVQKIVEHDNLIISHPGEVQEFNEDSEKIDSIIPLEQDLENNSQNKPKKIIGDLTVKILEVLPTKLDKVNLIKMISLFESSLAEKQVLFYFTDPILQSEFSRRNFTGEVKGSEHDYLMVINTNIAGQKSDRKMEEKIEHLSTVSVTGEITNSLKITRIHTGIKNEPLTGVRNVNWLRIYVPKGSQLINATETVKPDSEYFEEPEDDWLNLENLQSERLAIVDKKTGWKIYEENGKTVFANWVMTDPGEIQEIEITYQLPFNFFTEKSGNSLWDKLYRFSNPDAQHIYAYSLLVQKQPGAKPSQFISKISLPFDIKLDYQHPENLSWDKGWLIQSDLKTDKFFSILFKN